MIKAENNDLQKILDVASCSHWRHKWADGGTPTSSLGSAVPLSLMLAGTEL